MCGLWSKKTTERAAPERQFVLRVLADILEQRAKIRLVFEKTPDVPTLPASLVSVQQASLTLESPFMESHLKEIVGEEVACYVNIIERKTNQRIFYRFTSRLMLIESRRSGHTLITMSPPQEISPAQQRCSVRVPVDQDRIPLFIVWRELPSGCCLSETTQLLSSKSCGRNRFKIENISSCGLRVLLQNDLLSEVLPEQNVGEVFSFYFKAVEEPGTPAKPFLINAVLRNIHQFPKNETTSLGFEFIAQGGLNKHKKLVWAPLKSSEVYDLVALIFKWDRLDFYREKRVGA
jgi:hypothetical protein